MYTQLLVEPHWQCKGEKKKETKKRFQHSEPARLLLDLRSISEIIEGTHGIEPRACRRLHYQNESDKCYLKGGVSDWCLRRLWLN
jgi:hypothetical protein